MAVPFSLELLSSYALPGPWEADKVDSLGDHDWIAILRNMERVLDRGNWLFGAISITDQNWHTQVYEGKTLYDQAEEAEIVGFYKAWLGPTSDILVRIKELESRGFSVNGAGKFQDNCREVRSLLTDDSAFFDDDALTDLRDQAIDAHHEGRTADL